MQDLTGVMGSDPVALAVSWSAVAARMVLVVLIS
jgi:hypothetical protein